METARSEIQGLSDLFEVWLSNTLLLCPELVDMPEGA